MRSIDARTLRKLYDFNDTIKPNSLTDLTSTKKDSDGYRIWGGRNQRIMMQAMYGIAFLCLLRFDEVLRIQHHHIKVLNKEESKIEITLNFRKTHQLGDT